jgi:hypothetical protein
VFDGLSQAEVKQMFPAESGAVEDAARALQIEVGVQCRALPVLFRIWKSNEIPSSVTFTVQPDGTYKVMATTAAGGTAIATLTASLHDTLVTAYASNLSFASSIDGDASYVWRYPPLIDRALAQLQYSDPSVEVRAAQERLEAEGGMDAPTAASMAASSIELAAVAFAAAPEVLAVLAAITLIANAVSSIAEFAKTLQSDRAFDAVLDPDRAVASRPSYLGTVVNVVATLLDVKGFMGAARTAAYAREVPAVDKAVTAILP